MLAVSVHFSEQLKWSMESMATGCQDIPGIWLSIRQLGWVAKLFVPQMADQYNWLPISLAWRCQRVSSPFPLESKGFMLCVCACGGVHLFRRLGWDVQQVNARMSVCCLTWIMYEHMTFFTEHLNTKRTLTQICTKHIESIFEMYCRSSLVCWNKIGKATLKPQ